MKISGVVFDYGGVMTTSTMPQRVVELAKKKNVDWSVIERGFANHRLEYDGDAITLREMYEAIWRDAGLSIDEATTAEFMEEDAKSWLYRRERTREWMASLKSRGFKIGILTNMNSNYARDYFKKAFADYIALSDAMVVSGEERLVKPQPEIYRLLEKRLGLPPEELCFIDDVEKNVVAARGCGWHAIRFVSSEETEKEFERMLAS
ncbi:MAG: HAD family phosphatase [Kiritimatiellae bacterium]|nr:HAD family phosphatase [Kiritimatiellia bacterium]